MAAILYLDDGRDVGCSNIAIASTYFLIAREVRDRPRLRLWLFDLSEQAAPFFDIDTRALAGADRDEFWAAAQRAFDALAARSTPDFLDQSHAWTGNCLHRMLMERAKILGGDPPPPDARAAILSIDIERDRWLTDDQAEALIRQREADFQRFLADGS